MSLLVVGLSHRSAPVALLERAAVTGDRTAKLLRDMHSAEPVSEAILLSTCNRVEVYAEIDRFHAGVSAVSELIAQYAEVSLEELTGHLYVHYEDRAVQHMFSVACGLDSMVVGEGQILGQVREALKLAQTEETVGRTLNEVAQQALRVGKRAHTETRIDQAGADMVTVALSAAARQLGPLSGLRALVVGAGSMSALAANTLARGGVGEVAVANRTAERAERLAECLGSAYEGVTGRAVPFDAIGPALAEADLVISCTGAQGVVIGEADVRAARQGREAPLVVLDLALPHDVDPAVAELPGVTLVDLSRLQVASADGEGQTVTADDVAAVQRIVSDEVTAYLGEQRKARVAPTVVALRARAAGVVEAELARLLGRVPDLDERTRAEVTQALRRTADKILHQPTVRVKELAGSPGGAGYETALRELFDLDPKAPEAVARVELPGEDDA